MLCTRVSPYLIRGPNRQLCAIVLRHMGESAILYFRTGLINVSPDGQLIVTKIRDNDYIIRYNVF
jgi:hypothetical protein